MLIAYRRCARAVDSIDSLELRSLAPEVIWLDMYSPSPAELRWVESAVGIEMPTREEMREIEASARAYEEGSALVLTATILVHADAPPPDTTEVTFILKGDVLVTLRYGDPQPFRTMTNRLERNGPMLASAHAVFFWLVDQIIARTADVLERASQDVDALSTQIFKAARRNEGDDRIDLVEAISRIGRDGDTTSKVRESLHTLQRLLLAVSVSEILPPAAKKEARMRAKALNRDIQSLMEHTGFVTANVNLLLDATLGMINIEQTNIIKIFSVLAIVFLPPTLIASMASPACRPAATCCAESKSDAAIVGGTISPAEMFPRLPDAAIVAEPTEFDVVVAHQGVVRWRCHTIGRAAHTSRPDAGINAIYGMAQIVQAIERHHADLRQNGPLHPLCGRPSVCVSTIHGGVGVNTVPERATIEIDRRIGPDEQPEAAYDELVRFVAENADVGSCRVEHDPPFMQSRGLSDRQNQALAKSLAALVQKHGRPSELVGVPYATDAAAIAATASRPSSSAPAPSPKPTRPTSSSRSTRCNSRPKSSTRSRPKACDNSGLNPEP